MERRSWQRRACAWPPPPGRAKSGPAWCSRTAPSSRAKWWLSSRARSPSSPTPSQASGREIERPNTAPRRRASAHERRGPDTRADATSLEIEPDDAPALRADALIEHALAIRLETPGDALFEASGLLDEAGADVQGEGLDPLPANLAPGAASDLRH